MATCRGGDLPAQARPSTLAGTAWRAAQINARPTVPGSEPTLQFTRDELTGSTGCNWFFGGYRYQPSTGHIAIEVTGMTAAGCPGPAAAEIEALFVQALARVGSATMNPDGHLHLSGLGVEILLTVDAVPVPTPDGV
jgi:heat shock protein HslJ